MHKKSLLILLLLFQFSSKAMEGSYPQEFPLQIITNNNDTFYYNEEAIKDFSTLIAFCNFPRFYSAEFDKVFPVNCTSAHWEKIIQLANNSNSSINRSPNILKGTSRKNLLQLALIGDYVGNLSVSHAVLIYFKSVLSVKMSQPASLEKFIKKNSLIDKRLPGHLKRWMILTDTSLPQLFYPKPEARNCPPDLLNLDNSSGPLITFHNQQIILWNHKKFNIKNFFPLLPGFVFKKSNRNSILYWNPQSAFLYHLGLKSEKISGVCSTTEPLCASYIPNRKTTTVAFSNQNKIEIYQKNHPTFESVQSLEHENCMEMATNKNNSLLATNNGNTLKIWDAKDFKLLNELKGSWEEMEFTSGGNFLKVISRALDEQNNELYLINTKEYSLKKISGTQLVTASFDLKEKYLITVYSTNKIIIWDLATLTPLRTIEGKEKINAAFCTPDNLLYVQAADNKFLVYNLLTGKFLYNFSTTQPIINHSINDKKNCLITLHANNTIFIIPLKRFPNEQLLSQLTTTQFIFLLEAVKYIKNNRPYPLSKKSPLYQSYTELPKAIKNNISILFTS